MFSAPMVCAILEGRKTQTRRAIVPTITETHCSKECACGGPSDWVWKSHRSPHVQQLAKFCPYGAPGDRLWVRETCLPDPPRDGSWDDCMYDGDQLYRNLSVIPENYRHPEHVIYRAAWTGDDLRWLPSIHMPRWASRITLEVADVRVQRVQEISEGDCLAEGCGAKDRRVFAELWDSINAKRGFGWEANPWVWAITFRRRDEQQPRA